MKHSRRLHFTRVTAWTLVLGGHVLLLVLLSLSKTKDRQSTASGPEPKTILLLLDMAPPPIEAPSDQRSPIAPSIARVRAPKVAAESLGQAITPSEISAPSRAPVDWYSEAKEVAKDRGTELAATQPKKACDPSQSDRPGSLLPKCGTKKYKDTSWDPAPPKAGFSGLLPFVMIGKRCAVGLGFFGCALGKLPDADGHVFDEMNDPDRPRSSVPDIPGKEGESPW
jgi:hypothetical protein